MKTAAKQQYAGYGLHYHANNQLFSNVNDRVLVQCLIDLVRKQLMESLENQTIIISQSRLSALCGLSRYHSLPASINRLEELGVIKKYKNGFLVHCDEYVAVVQHYESLDKNGKDEFAREFAQLGMGVLPNRNIVAKPQCRVQLLGLSGSSISLSQGECCQTATLSGCDSENVAKPQHFEQTNSKTLRFGNNEESLHSDENVAVWQHFAQTIAETLRFGNIYGDSTLLEDCLNVAVSQQQDKNDLKYAIETGKMPESVINDPSKTLRFGNFGVAVWQLFTSKTLRFGTPVIIEDKIKEINEIFPFEKGSKGEQQEENFQEEIKKGFEGFDKVEVVNFDKPSEEVNKRALPVEEENSQQVLKRADRKMRARNSYRNKPFIKVERVKEIVDCLDEVVQSPVDFFLYQFWWGVYDLYCDHYHPCEKIDENGEPEEDIQSYDWKEMIGAPLPQDEIYQLAKNVYEDLTGAVEQGQYIYGDNNEWRVTFSFDSFDDFISYEIFQWTPCTMQDKSIPALKVAIDKFYDIEAKDVTVSSKGSKKVKTAQNKKLVQLLLSTEAPRLSPIEEAVKKFYEVFVVRGEDDVIDEFTDGMGTPLELGGGLPDHILKPWCYNLPSVTYNEFTGTLCGRYKPIEGIHKKAYIFSADAVVEWNERNGYTNTIAHQAIQ